jgi:hypothetical protein
MARDLRGEETETTEDDPETADAPEEGATP